MSKTVLLALLLASSAVASDVSVFRNTDVFELEFASDQQISPDGSRIAYVRRTMDIMTDRAVSNIWLIDRDGENHRPLLSGADNFNQPRWSPNGDRIAYVTAKEGRGAQLHVLWMDSGQSAMLTNVRDSPTSISWSPDGKTIAFEMLVPVINKPLVEPPKAPEGANWAPPVTVIDEMPYRWDGAGYLESGYSHLFILPADGGTPRQLSKGNYDHNGPFVWMPDGTSIIFSSNRQADAEHDPVESELWSLDISTGEMKQMTRRNGPDSGPTLSPDGSKLAFRGFDDKKMGYHNTHVYLMDMADGDIRNMTPGFDRRIDDVQWAGSSNSLLVQYDDRGRTHIAHLSMDGEIESITDDVGGVTLGRPYTSGGFSVANNGAFAYSAGRPDRPADVGTGRGKRATQRITDLNEDLLGHKAMGNVEEINWNSSADGLEIQGWLVTPPGFDPSRKYPLILEIHGGPFAAYGPQFSAEAQLYAAAGYVVLYCNPRGSTSYGYEFANRIHHNYPGQDYDDLMSGVDGVIAKGFIDADQLYVTGGSGGGVLSAWIVGKTDRFRAAVVAKPVINWTSFSLTADFMHMFTRYWFPAMPWEDPDGYWARSPLSLVGNVTTPTALLTGEFDYRTPISESEQLYQALKLRKVDTVLIRIPEASHGIVARPSNLIAKVDNILAWFRRYAD